MSRRVVVIGGGIVGAASAFELTRAGAAVTLLDPGPPGGPQAASFGNGAWISPSSVVPMSLPGLWRKVPGYLLDPLGPFTIRPAALPRLAPWLWRFVRAGSTEAKVEATARALRALVSDAPGRHAALAAEAGVPELIRREGLLYVYPDRAAFLAEAFAWRLRRDNGVDWTELDRAALAAREPGLAERYGFGALVAEGAHCLDPGSYVAAVAAASGAEIRTAGATGFDIRDGRLRSVETSEGPIPCGHAVIAAGIGSAALARAAGTPVPLVSERGYHVVIAAPEAGPRGPVMPSDGKMANTPTAEGLRAAGQVELAGPDDPPDWRRADILLDHLRRTFPGLPADLPPHRVSRWMGHRPSTPDGLPVIGPSRGSPDVVLAFGHGHIGLAAGAMTGRLAADLVVGRSPAVPLAPYAPTRF